MRTLIALLLTAASGFGAAVTFDLTNFVQGVALPTNTVCQVFLDKPTVTGSGVSIGNPARVAVGSTTNLATGKYTLTVNNETWKTPLSFTVPTSGAYTLSQLVTNAPAAITNAPFVTQLISGTTNVSLSPTNGRGVVIISVSGGSGSGDVTQSQLTTATNSVFQSATNAAKSYTDAMVGTGVATNFPYTAITNAPWLTNGATFGIGSGSTATNLTVYNGLKLGNPPLGSTAGIFLVKDYATDGICDTSIRYTNGVIYGSGAGLTNLQLAALPSGVLTNNNASAVTIAGTLSGNSVISAGTKFAISGGPTMSQWSGGQGLVLGKVGELVPTGTLLASNAFFGGTITATNGYFLPTNTLSSWPASAPSAGAAFLGNSNGTVYLLKSTAGSTAWASTNLISQGNGLLTTNDVMNLLTNSPIDAMSVGSLTVSNASEVAGVGMTNGAVYGKAPFRISSAVSGTDSTATIQGELNQIGAAGGGALIIRAGTYYLTSTLSITNTNTVVMGEGFATRLVATAQISNIISAKLPIDPLTIPNHMGMGGVAIRDLWIDSSVTQTSGAAIYMRQVHAPVISGVRIGTVPTVESDPMSKIYDGVVLDGHNDSRIDNFEVGHINRGISLMNPGWSYSYNGLLTGRWFITGHPTNRTSCGVFVDGGGGIQLNQGTIAYEGTNVFLKAAVQVFINDCFLDLATWGIVVPDSGNGEGGVNMLVCRNAFFGATTAACVYFCADVSTQIDIMNCVFSSSVIGVYIGANVATDWGDLNFHCTGNQFVCATNLWLNSPPSAYVTGLIAANTFVGAVSNAAPASIKYRANSGLADN